jgi:hypothetical protein
MNCWPASSLAALAAWCLAAPAFSQTACYVRAEAGALTSVPASASGPEGSEPRGAEARGAQSHLGMRRKSDKLFDLDIAVVGPGEAVCSVGGVARLSGEAGREALAMVVRPDPARKIGRTGTLCQVFVHLTPTAVELRTTPSACQAQALCEGRVELNGQRFEQATRLPTGTPGPCFGRKVL